MAVRHGYGKIAGTDALVFAYDTGDTRNSYRGEPTVNLAVNPTFSSTSNWAIASNGGGTFSVLNNYGKITAGSIGSYSYVYQTISTTVASNESITWSIEFKNNVVGDYAIRVVLFLNGTPKTQPTTFFSLNGTGGTIRKSVTTSHVDGGNSIRIDILQGSYYAGITTDNNLEFTNAQLERNSHLTQFVAGTRSATQGLLDLTGNNTINITNLSFDSNAHPTWDGTNDSLAIGTIDGASALSQITIETVVRSTANNKNIVYSGGNGIILHYGGAGFYLVASDNTASGYLGWNSEIAGGTGVYEHLVATWDGSTMKLYVNGTKTTYDKSFTGGSTGVLKALTSVYTGLYFNGTQPYFQGDMDIFKIYSRALTAAEVRNNYRHYKTRFNIS